MFALTGSTQGAEGQLRKLQWTFVFHKRRKISFIAKRLSASQGFCNILFVGLYYFVLVPVGAQVCGRSPVEIVGSNPIGAWMILCCEYCVLSGRGLCDELIARPEESYLLWCVVMCDLETSRMRSPWSLLGHNATENINLFPSKDCMLHPHVSAVCHAQFIYTANAELDLLIVKVLIT